MDRCPKCGAAVRFGDPWCTLCYADLRPPAASPAQPPPIADPPAYTSPPVAATDPLTAPIETVSSPAASPVTGPSWPCAACGTVNPMADDTCSACGRHFLAGLREDQAALLELPVLGDITRLGRGQRFAVAMGAVFAFVLLTVLLGLLFS